MLIMISLKIINKNFIVIVILKDINLKKIIMIYKHNIDTGLSVTTMSSERRIDFSFVLFLFVIN